MSTWADVACAYGKIIILGVRFYIHQTHMPTNGGRCGTQLGSELSLMGCRQPTPSRGKDTCGRRLPGKLPGDTGQHRPSEDSQPWPSGKESPLGGEGLASEAPPPKGLFNQLVVGQSALGSNPLA